MVAASSTIGETAWVTAVMVSRSTPPVAVDRDPQRARPGAAEELDVVDVESERGDGGLDGGAYRFELRVRRTHSPRLPRRSQEKTWATAHVPRPRRGAQYNRRSVAQTAPLYQARNRAE